MLLHLHHFCQFFSVIQTLSRILTPKGREPLTGKVLNMPKINAQADVCVFTTVAFLQRCPKATVLEAMKVGGFSDAEIYDRVKQAWIYRCWKKSPAGTKND
jgi:hypothetical protein